MSLYFIIPSTCAWQLFYVFVHEQWPQVRVLDGRDQITELKPLENYESSFFSALFLCLKVELSLVRLIFFLSLFFHFPHTHTFEVYVQWSREGRLQSVGLPTSSPTSSTTRPSRLCQSDSSSRIEGGTIPWNSSRSFFYHLCTWE